MAPAKQPTKNPWTYHNGKNKTTEVLTANMSTQTETVNVACQTDAPCETPQVNTLELTALVLKIVKNFITQLSATERTNLTGKLINESQPNETKELNTEMQSSETYNNPAESPEVNKARIESNEETNKNPKRKIKRTISPEIQQKNTENSKKKTKNEAVANHKNSGGKIGATRASTAK